MNPGDINTLTNARNRLSEFMESHGCSIHQAAKVLGVSNVKLLKKLLTQKKGNHLYADLVIQHFGVHGIDASVARLNEMRNNKASDETEFEKRVRIRMELGDRFRKVRESLSMTTVQLAAEMNKCPDIDKPFSANSLSIAICASQVSSMSDAMFNRITTALDYVVVMATPSYTVGEGADAVEVKKEAVETEEKTAADVPEGEASEEIIDTEHDGLDPEDDGQEARMSRSHDHKDVEGRATQDAVAEEDEIDHSPAEDAQRDEQQAETVDVLPESIIRRHIRELLDTETGYTTEELRSIGRDIDLIMAARSSGASVRIIVDTGGGA